MLDKSHLFKILVTAAALAMTGCASSSQTIDEASVPRVNRAIKNGFVFSPRGPVCRGYYGGGMYCVPQFYIYVNTR